MTTKSILTEAMAPARVAIPGWWRRRVLALNDFLRHMRRRWYLYLPVLAIWCFAYVRLFIDPTPRMPILVNWTPSLPYHLALMQFQQQPVRRGDLIVFAFAGEAQAHYPGLRGQPFFKQVRGMPGDVVTVLDRTVFVNGEAVGLGLAAAARLSERLGLLAAGEAGRIEAVVVALSEEVVVVDRLTMLPVAP